MRGLTALALTLAVWPALAQEASDLAPDSAPAPAARPDEAQVEAAPEPVEQPEEAPVPQSRPSDDENAAASQDAPALIPPEEPPPEEAPSAEPSDDVPALVAPEETDSADDLAAPPEEPTGPPMREVLTETPEDLAACLAALDTLGVVHERTEPVAEPDVPDCGMVNPVTVTEIAPGVALEPPSPMRCATALAAARWAADVVVPLARKLGRGEITAIDQGSPYDCRPRADGAMSEHAWGHALDVMGFRFSEGEPMPVQPRAGDGTLDEAFQRAVRAGACLDFTTVLGPGSDEDHADHLHFDIRERDGDFRICE